MPATPRDGWETEPRELDEVRPGLDVGSPLSVPAGRYALVVTLDASLARVFPPPPPARHLVLDLRDAYMEREDEVVEVVGQVVSTLADGGRVLVRCAMGLNRSGLIAAGTLIALGTDPDAAIAELRAVRHPDMLGNDAYVGWLTTDAVRLLRAAS